MHYYNEYEPYPAQWLRNLIAAGMPAGQVDERSIVDVQPDDLDGFTQCHFFAGIGGWPLALALAGWPADREVWTGSCPCQPFSAAGKGLGVKDERHLWPQFKRLIERRRPATVFGEQVASKDGRAWLAVVRREMEALGYRFGAADMCSAGVGADHIRQRLYWVADAAGCGSSRGHGAAREDGAEIADGRDGIADGLGDTIEPRLQRHAGHGDGREEPGRLDALADGSAAAAGARYEILPYSDPKRGTVYRRSQPGSFPLAHGLPRSVGQFGPGRKQLRKLATASLKAAKANRVGRLKGYGNAIDPRLAAVFIQAFMESI